VKLKNLIVILVLTPFLISCSKIKQVKVSADISGKWNVVSDSSIDGFGINNHAINFIGQPGDCFNFSASGSLYIKEGLDFDTLKYKLVINSSIVIDGFGATLNGIQDTTNIINFTPHTAVVSSPLIITPGGEFQRKVTLSR
jgi:hypothetical protein